MNGTSAPTLASPRAPGVPREILLAVDPGAGGAAAASSLGARLASRVDGRPVAVLVPSSLPGSTLVDPADPRAASPVPGLAMAGGFAHHALGSLLREADARGAIAAALVVASGREEDADRLRTLLSPILEGDFELVWPCDRRPRLDGLLATAILYPLTRALYGATPRQPASGEVAISLGLARHLLADLDWRRDPEHAGSEAWVVGKVLSERRRACQAWLGAGNGDGAPEDASHALARLVGPVFVEMERRADRWQRVEGSRPLPSFGDPGVLPEGPAGVDVAALTSNLRLGLRELDAVWGLVLPPATRLELRRAAAAPPELLRLDDSLWARVVYDFAVAHFVRTLERGQLLRSMTPLYRGWVAGFVNEVAALDAVGTEARVEALCGAFDREKTYLIRRWRWPDSFNP
jgi:hypothetical protein